MRPMPRPPRPRPRLDPTRLSGPGHSHGHAHGARRSAAGDRAVATPGARRVLAWLLLPILLLTAGGVITSWPHDAPGRGVIDVTADTAGMVTGDVVGQATPDGLVPVRLDDGAEVTVLFPPEHVEAGIPDGATIRALHIPEAAAAGSAYVFMDYDRQAPIALLAALYALVVVAVARWRGIAAMLGLAASFAIVVTYTMPNLLAGSPALPIALLTSSAVMFLTLYLAHGISARTSTALLGTMIGLGLTAALAQGAAAAARITGLSDEYARQLPAFAPAVDVQALVTCGIVLAGLGVLNDVTITQASAVWELREVSPTLSRRELFRRGMRIGRDHIASTVYTIAFAYLGAALPLLLTVSLINQSLTMTLTSGEIATEVVRTLVGSIGLVLAIPATTAIAAIVVAAPAEPAGAHAVPAEDASEPARPAPA